MIDNIGSFCRFDFFINLHIDLPSLPKNVGEKQLRPILPTPVSIHYWTNHYQTHSELR